MKKINKKAFTLIELLVVIAVIGILVLLAVPRFIGHTQKAEDARVQHDVKVMEQEIGTMFINGDDDLNKWGNNIKYLNQLVQDNKLFEKKGHVVDPIDGTYKVIPEEYKGKINTKLKGTFYASSDGKVYYEHGKGLRYSDEEIDDLKNKGFIPVATAEELNNIRNDTERTYGKGTDWEDEYTGGLDKKYVQVKDIDLSEYGDWTPIGTLHANFRGTYDGGNYVIKDLEVKGDGKDYQGLFGFTQGATIRNVALEDVNVAGKQSVGGLVGWAQSGTKIINSYATGEVTGTGRQVGGLVGYATNSTIENSYATGSVTVTGSGEYSNAGGLVGEAYVNTNINNSYATGEVTGTGRQVGGLAGLADNAKISNSYATGAVEGTGRVGGLVGYAKNVNTISNSYATGLVKSQNYGGLVGWADSIKIISSYWDKETTGLTRSVGGIGKSTVDMKNQATYEGWDFDSVWEITPGNYPTLR